MSIGPEYRAKLSALQGKLVLVTGGCGFVGRHIVELLIEVGARVRVFDIFIKEYAVEGGQEGKNPQFIKGDLLNSNDLDAALSGCWACIHVASPPPQSKNEKLFMSVNVDGTKNVLEACRRQQVTRFVYTSSASLIFDGSDQCNLNEDSPMPTKPHDSYTHSKLLGEQEVLKFNCKEVLTCAMRPHGIFGPRDPNLVPALAQAARQNKSRYIVGSGLNVADFTYVTNVAYAHLLAACQLKDGSPLCGRAYFITNQEPVLFWDFMAQIYHGLGYAQPWLPMPMWLMMPIAKMGDMVHQAFPKVQPLFNTQRVTYLGRHHYYSSDKATKDFGYTPAVPLGEALRRTLASFPEQRNPKPAVDSFKRDVDFSTKFLISALVLLVVLAVLLMDVLPISSVIKWGLVILTVGYLANMMAELFARRRMCNVNTNLHGKFAVVTGGNKGIGMATCVELARRGCRVVLGCRDQGRAMKAVEDILKASGAKTNLVSSLPLDLSSLRSVRAFVSALQQQQGAKIDFLVNNAGAMVPKSITEDGYDCQFQTNHLGHFHLTNLLIDNDMLAPRARVANLSSYMHFMGHLETESLGQGSKATAVALMNSVNAYCDTKLMNVLFSNELYRRRLSERRMTSVAIHPGTVDSDFTLHFIPEWLRDMVSPLFKAVLASNLEGAQTTLYALTSPDLEGVGGVYLDNCKSVLPSLEARNPGVAAKLWEDSEQLASKGLAASPSSSNESFSYPATPLSPRLFATGGRRSRKAD